MFNWTAAQKQKIPFSYGALYSNPGTTDQQQLGISKGGGEIEITPEVRYIDADGVKGKKKGLAVVDGINATIKTVLMNVSLDMLFLAMPYAKMTGTPGSYTKLSLDKDSLGLIPDTSYLDKLALCVKTYENKYVKVDMANAMSAGNVVIAATQKEEGGITFEFAGHWDNEDEAAEFLGITYEDALPVAAE